MGRAAWLAHLKRVNEQQEDALAPVYDERWGAIDETHRQFVEAFLARLPAGGSVLDAGCGTGRFFPLVLASGRGVTGVDRSAASLEVAKVKYPEAQTIRAELQSFPAAHQYDGVMCVDALEMNPPEEWPAILNHLRLALNRGGVIYVTIELPGEEQLRLRQNEARRAGFPIVSGEWVEPNGFYHYYPPLSRARTWISGTGFVIEQEREGPRDPDGHAYHHILAKLNPGHVW
jgi:SAM-dependent methyltransferase